VVIKIGEAEEATKTEVVVVDPTKGTTKSIEVNN
jgi:hypothetical protein